MAGVNGGLLDNVCCSQDSAIMAQNGIRKSYGEAVVSLQRHGNLHKHNRTPGRAENIPHSQKKTSVDTTACNLH